MQRPSIVFFFCYKCFWAFKRKLQSIKREEFKIKFSVKLKNISFCLARNLF